MNISTYNKDHLKEHAGVALAAPVRIDAPQSNDPLVFWTQHEKEPFEVNLHPFATGQEKSNHKKGAGKNFIPFTGRPALIRQLAPVIEEALLWAPKATVRSYLSSLREWWRVLDVVEASAATTSQPMTRVEDVRLLTNVHCEFAHRRGIPLSRFGIFRRLVDTTRMAIGVRQTYWESPEGKDTQKHIPSQEQRDTLRFAVRGACRKVLQRWEQSDRLSQIDTKPDDPQEAKLWRNVRYMRGIQKETGKVLPTPNDLHGGIAPWALNPRGNFKSHLRDSIFPNHRDAEAIWHQCLLNTGWNPSTLTSLNVDKKILIDHFKNLPNDDHRRFVLFPKTYELVGEKERAGGKEQFVTGQWKTLDGPGHLIKTYLERVEPLREVLKQQLVQAQLKYKQMDDADYKVRTTQFARVNALEQGVRSVWLYVGRFGVISWIQPEGNNKSGIIDGKQVSFLEEVVHLLNTKRAVVTARQSENSEGLLEQVAFIPRVMAKNFRVWFADYVYRKGNGNMLHVKRALNHARLGTSSGYTNTNILNQEASDAARQFLNILVGELEVGRVDLTILAYLYRYGKVTSEQEEILAQLRALPKSRMKVACKDAAHPPAHLKATANEPCDVQRCMLCLDHAVLLPESLDGIAMRVEELRALQGYLPIETWIDERYDIELKNNLRALNKFDLNKGMAARKKWALAIASGDHFVPGLPLASSPNLMELV